MTRHVRLSPVPVGGALPPRAGYFCMLSESAPEIRTRWRMTQSVANPSPKAEFPAIREKYREFGVFEADTSAGSDQSPRDHCAF